LHVCSCAEFSKAIAYFAIYVSYKHKMFYETGHLAVVVAGGVILDLPVEVVDGRAGLRLAVGRGRLVLLGRSGSNEDKEGESGDSLKRRFPWLF